MDSQARFWIPFVIVAVGLVLSWGQVGRKTVQVLEEEDVAYLWTEEPCAPRVSPCAASASDVALVLGPAPDGLRLRAIGPATVDATSLQADYLADDGRVLSSRVVERLAVKDGWTLPDPGVATRARIYLGVPGRELVAEFPL